MKILFVADAASIHTRRWLEYFSKKGLDVHVASFRNFVIPGVTVHLLPQFGLGKIGYFSALWILPRIYSKIRPDIVHAHYITSYGFLAAFSGLKPLVVTAWGSDVLIAPSQSNILRYFAHYAVRNASAVTTLAEHMNPSVIKLGAEAGNIKATPFGVDVEHFVPLIRNDSSMQLKLICTRNFDFIYDVQTLIKAIAIIISRGREIKVNLIGDGPLRKNLEDLVFNLGLSSDISFLGHVEHKKLPSLLANADIFVSPALSDGNNVSLNEAMACGCFPIATDIPANSQWIRDQFNGYLYPPGDVNALADSIENAIDNPTIRSFSKLENRRIVETRADWRICVKKMEEIYFQVSGKIF